MIAEASGRRGANRSPHDGMLHRAEELAAQLPPLMVAAERVAATVSQGVHGRRRVGQGESFWQFRRYQPGDSTLRIDWRQSAKSQRVYIRQTEWEAAQSVWLWSDASPSMRYRSIATLPAKAERADLLLLALAALLTRGGERVAVLGSGSAPRPGRAAIRRCAADLDRRRPGSGAPPVEPLPRHARLVAIGDLLEPLDAVKEMIGGYAARGIRGHLVQVLDPAEETLPFSGRVHFHGAEGDGDMVFGRVESIRDAYRAAFDAHHRGLEALARTAGWTFVTHRTDRPPEPVLLSLFLALAETTER